MTRTNSPPTTKSKSCPNGRALSVLGERQQGKGADQRLRFFRYVANQFPAAAQRQIKLPPAVGILKRGQFVHPRMIGGNDPALECQVQGGAKGRGVAIVGPAAAAMDQDPLLPARHLGGRELGQFDLGDRVAVDQSAKPARRIDGSRFGVLDLQFFDVGSARFLDVG